MTSNGMVTLPPGRWTVVLIEADHSYSLHSTEHVGSTFESFEGNRYVPFKCSIHNKTIWARREV